MDDAEDTAAPTVESAEAGSGSETGSGSEAGSGSEERGWFGRKKKPEEPLEAQEKRGWFGRKAEKEVEGNLTKKEKRGWFGGKIENNSPEEPEEENKLEKVLKEMKEADCPDESTLEDQWMNEAVAFLEFDGGRPYKV